MTNAQHTPGNWIYTLDTRGVCGIHAAPDCSKPSIRIGEVVADTQCQAEANARLIAAAPELLDELEATNILLLNIIHDLQEKGTPWETLQKRWAYNRTAIAKAKGE